MEPITGEIFYTLEYDLYESFRAKIEDPIYGYLRDQIWDQLIEEFNK